MLVLMVTYLKKLIDMGVMVMNIQDVKDFKYMDREMNILKRCQSKHPKRWERLSEERKLELDLICAAYEQLKKETLST